MRIIEACLHTVHECYRLFDLRNPSAPDLMNDEPGYLLTGSTDDSSRSRTCYNQPEDMIESLKATLADKEDELADARRREQDVRGKVDALESHLREVIQQRDHWRDHANRLDGTISQLEHTAEQKKRHVAELERAVSLLNVERQNTATLLETRAAELREAQAYLTKVDDVADSDVLSIVKQLNSFIYQTAATVANTFQARYGLQCDYAVTQHAGMRLQTSGLLGGDLIHALSAVDHREDPLLVQTALQAAMVSFTRWMCTTWTFRIGEPSYPLQNIYLRIREHEPQSVSGRWRALSHAHIKEFLAGDTERRQAVAKDIMATYITDVLIASGVCGAHSALIEEAQRVSSEAIHEIAMLALQVHKITGEHIVSRDLFTVVAETGVSFNPDRMTDEWKDPRRRRGQMTMHPVLCTTQLGLVREEICAGGQEENPNRFETVLLLKPTVVLKSMLEELYDEQKEGSPRAR